MKIRPFKGGPGNQLIDVEEIPTTIDAVVDWIAKALVKQFIIVDTPITAKDLSVLVSPGLDTHGWRIHAIRVRDCGLIAYADSWPIHVWELEQEDLKTIKHERDLLAQAIAKLGIDIGLISPTAVLTGPHLLQICEDIVEINKSPDSAEKRRAGELNEAYVTYSGVKNTNSAITKLLDRETHDTVSDLVIGKP